MLAAMIGVPLQRTLDRAIDAEAHWAPGPAVWVMTDMVAAGERISSASVRRAVAPSGLVPAGAVADDPVGQRARQTLHTGQIVLADQLSVAGSANSARIPLGWVAIALDRTSDLFETGDQVELHDVLDGQSVASLGVVVAVTDGDLSVAVEPEAVTAVIRALGRGGVVPVLRG